MEGFILLNTLAQFVLVYGFKKIINAIEFKGFYGILIISRSKYNRGLYFNMIKNRLLNTSPRPFSL